MLPFGQRYEFLWLPSISSSSSLSLRRSTVTSTHCPSPITQFSNKPTPSVYLVISSNSDRTFVLISLLFVKHAATNWLTFSFDCPILDILFSDATFVFFDLSKQPFHPHTQNCVMSFLVHHSSHFGFIILSAVGSVFLDKIPASYVPFLTSFREACSLVSFLRARHASQFHWGIPRTISKPHGYCSIPAYS